MNENGLFPNDILLSVNDLAISRTHARLILPVNRKCPLKWIEFMKLFWKKNRQFPRDVQRIIIKFLREKREIRVQDLGSLHGTYV